jgi:hypothetical protein
MGLLLGDESIIEAFDEPSTDGLERIVASVFVEGPWSAPSWSA